MITETFFGEAIGDRPQIQDPIPYVACTCHGFRRVESIGVFFPAGVRYVAMRNPQCPIHGGSR